MSCNSLRLSFFQSNMQNIAMHHRHNFALVKAEKKAIKQINHSQQEKQLTYSCILCCSVIFNSFYLQMKESPC